MAARGAGIAARVLLALAALLGGGGCGTSTTGGDPDGARPPDGGAGLAADAAGTGDAARPTDAAGAAGDDSGAAAVVLAVGAAQNVLALDSCEVTPATIPDVAAGAYTITLTASTLSKGSVATSPPAASVDNYVIVQLPLASDDPQRDHRFFMLNGIGASYELTLGSPGTIQVMFVDSDVEANVGEALVSLDPGGHQTTVSAVANVLRWRDGCNSTPATVELTARPHEVKLLTSTLTWSGMRGDYVLLRLPSEVPQDDHRYVILNGVDASQVFTPSTADGLRAWYVSPSGASSGQATLVASDF